MNNPDRLFEQGVLAFNAGEYYDAHEFWEELWSDHIIPDRIFIQGLIQLAVACFHITNLNMKGARSLFKKSMGKFEEVKNTDRISNYPEITKQIPAASVEAEVTQNPEDFNWKLIPKIKL